MQFVILKLQNFAVLYTKNRYAPLKANTFNGAYFWLIE